ncbi:MAG TPA: S1 RNA-binding domain-containing protein, partial [Candidatus Limnocylindrales bacterium]|nr:S1 RNA-binding domain-containing protein [Candidatus Limnocylindrales bacterium]
MEDFATALESYTLETEPAPSEDNVFKGTVIKITPTHVVVDIGFKSEGLVPIAEVTDAQGNVKFQPGDQIEVMVQRGENEEGAVLLSHERAERVRVWENIEKAYHSKEAIKG